MRKPLASPSGRVHMHLVVSDMKTSIDFYTTVLGFVYDHGVREMAWLVRGELLLTLSPGLPAQGTAAYFGWTVGSAEDLDRLYERLHARGHRLSEPPDPQAGQHWFFLYDPDSHPICFSVDLLENPLRSER